MQERVKLNQYTAVFIKRKKWWIGYAEETPGAITQGSTLEETRENLKEAISLVLEANRDLNKMKEKSGKVIREPILVPIVTSMS
ncbi:MAG: type II toxin-antitoxin system HicB family antitoxin [bacterium]|nr:type II toxin-antitoxin system HicB family antitoxin [bacterium]